MNKTDYTHIMNELESPHAERLGVLLEFLDDGEWFKSEFAPFDRTWYTVLSTVGAKSIFDFDDTFDKGALTDHGEAVLTDGYDWPERLGVFSRDSWPTTVGESITAQTPGGNEYRLTCLQMGDYSPRYKSIVTAWAKSVTEIEMTIN